VIPDVMGMRPLFDGLVARLAAEWGLSVAAFEIYPGREDLDVAARLAAAQRSPTTGYWATRWLPPTSLPPTG